MGLETQHVIGMHIWSWLFCSLTLLHQHQPGKKEVQDYIKTLSMKILMLRKKANQLNYILSLLPETYFAEVLGQLKIRYSKICSNVTSFGYKP